MPHIDIHVERPWMTLALIGTIAFVIIKSVSGTAAVVPVGGDTDSDPQNIAIEATGDMAELRDEQQVLIKREEILRDQLAQLEHQIESGDMTDMQSYLTTRDELIRLLTDRSEAEHRIVESLHEYWSAEGYAYEASRQRTGEFGDASFVWPIEPEEGISAHFKDSGYQKRFGMPHHAVDIPAPQGTIVGAAAEGIVTNVTDQGMGFNSLVIRHADGFSTLYGHVTKFLVKEGDHVRAGEPIALSGGKPGTKGAGLMTTGAHLHLALYKDGEVVDPLDYLPSSPGVR